jgi:hypothetical protein
VIAMPDRSQNHNRRYLPELAICGVLVLLSLRGMSWYETTGLLKHDIDGLLLMSICLLIGTIFSVQFVFIARNTEWIKFPGRHRTKAAALSSTLQQAHPMHAGGQLAGCLK